MANRRFNQFRGALVPVVKDLWARVSFAAAGAPTLVTSITLANSQTVNPSKGIASITRQSAGLYTLTLEDQYVSMLDMDCVFVSATIPASPDMNAVTSLVNSTPPTIQIQFSAAGVATDPASGEQARLHIALMDSTAP